MSPLDESPYESSATTGIAVYDQAPYGGLRTNTRPGVLRSPAAPTITVLPNATHELPRARTC